MARFPNLGENTSVPDILKMSPVAGKALMELHEAIMRGDDSPLSEGERELIAAYVSGINECRYCHGVHAQTAKAYGLDDNAIDSMFDSLEGFDEKMKPILRMAKKLTEQPAGLTDEDTQAVLEAGWSEKALHDAVLVVCCFNFMNRLLEGHGVHGNEKLYKERGPMLKKYGYLPLIRIIMPEDKSAAE